MQDRCTVCTEHTIGSEIILDTPDETQGDVGHVESYFGPFSDSADLDARYVHGLRRTYHRLTNCFGSTGWNSNLISVLLETMLV
jgi:hypothetical protein